MRVAWPRSEQELCAASIPWLEADGWTVYQEVQVVAYGSVADIVATRDRLIWVIEAKRSFGISVVEQAVRWTTFTHAVSILIPQSRSYHDRPAWGGPVGTWLLDQYGLGLLTCSEGGYVNQRRPPRLNRRIVSSVWDGRLTPTLHEWQAEAGEAVRRHWTPFRQTLQNLRAYVARHPGCTMKEAMTELQHHYNSTATCRSTLTRLLSFGLLKGIKGRKEGRTWRLFLEEATQ